MRNNYLPEPEVAQLETFAEWSWFECEGRCIYGSVGYLTKSAALKRG